MSLDAPAAHSYMDPPSNTPPCARCAALVPLATADYNAQGDIECTRCAAANGIEASEQRAVTAMKAGGFANSGTGILPWFFDSMWIVTIGAIVTAVLITRAVYGYWYPRRIGRVRFLVSA